MAYTSGQTEERDVKTLPGIAGEAISPFRILKAGVDADEVLVATAGTVFPIGVSGNGSENNKGTYAEHDRMAIKYDGIVFVEMSGAGSRHNRVIATTAGKGIKHTTATAGVYIFGVAMEAWVDGQIIPVMIDRMLVTDTASISTEL